MAIPTEAPIVTRWPSMHVGPRNLLDQRPGEGFEQADVDRAGKHRLELVAAEPPDLAMIAHHRLQPLGDLAEQGVADRMAERVVDVLEAVEIDQEQGAALLAVGGVAQRLVERLAHHRAVGQAGQRIEAREPGDFLLGAALLGEVGADAAEAEEAAALVEDRDCPTATSGCPRRWRRGRRRRRMGSAPTDGSPASCAPRVGAGGLVSTDSRSVNWRPSSSSGSHWKSSASCCET